MAANRLPSGFPFRPEALGIARPHCCRTSIECVRDRLRYTQLADITYEQSGKSEVGLAPGVGHVLLISYSCFPRRSGGLSPWRRVSWLRYQGKIWLAAD